MEKHIFKKFNSLELIKKILVFYLFDNIKQNQKIFFNKFIRIVNLFQNHYFFVPNGLKFIKIHILFFFIGFPIGSFILTKKHNKHMSLKKLKTKKR